MATKTGSMAAASQAIWSQWRRLTRLHNVASYAMAVEWKRSTSAPIVSRKDVQLEGQPFIGKFKLKLSEYDEALADQSFLSEAVLVLSWALFETYCKGIVEEIRAKNSSFKWKDAYWKKSVEVWGFNLLEARGLEWAKVLGGKSAIVEASLLRNAIAHGQRNYSENMVNRANSLKIPCVVGEAIVVDFDRCERLRSSLKSFARVVEAQTKRKRS